MGRVKGTSTLFLCYSQMELISVICLFPAFYHGQDFSQSVFTHLSYWVPATTTNYHRLSVLSNKHFSQFWRLGSLRSRCWQFRCLTRALFLAHSWLSSTRSILMTSLPPKAPLPNTFTWRIRALACEFWNNTVILLSAPQNVCPSHLQNTFISSSNPKSLNSF